MACEGVFFQHIKMSIAFTLEKLQNITFLFIFIFVYGIWGSSLRGPSNVVLQNEG